MSSENGLTAAQRQSDVRNQPVGQDVVADAVKLRGTAFAARYAGSRRLDEVLPCWPAWFQTPDLR